MTNRNGNTRVAMTVRQGRHSETRPAAGTPSAPSPGDARPAAVAARPPISAEALETSRLVVDLVHAALSAGGPSYGRRSPDGFARASAGEAAGAGASGASAAGAEGAPPIHGDRPTQLSPHAVRASVAIYQRGQCTVGELAAMLGISLGWASRIAEELETRGYAVRERSAEDRRVVRLRLSERALDEVDRAYRWRGDAVERALEPLDAAGREAVRGFLRRLAEEFTAGSGR